FDALIGLSTTAYSYLPCVRSILAITPPAPASVSLTSSGSSDPDGDAIVKEEWQNKLNSYPAGSHTVKLRVQDSQGAWSDWASYSFSVADPAAVGGGVTTPSPQLPTGNRPPLARIYLYPGAEFSANTPVIWLAQGSDPDGDAIIAEEWQNRQSSYPEGEHVVRLRVQDSRGAWSDWTEQRIVVGGNRPPQSVVQMFPDFNLTPSTVVYFFNGSWDPDGDTIESEEWENRQETYAVGRHTVRLRVKDSKGAWSSWTERSFVVSP
ncbi:MAG: hypothetical protein ACM3ZQ_05810, partial [Bacillota bacterium]